MTILGRRALNRALLARQHLLCRAELPVVEAVEALVGLQSQAPDPPYVGLWTRLAGFRHEDLGALFPQREVVRIALWRNTIHLVSARDCRALRPVMQPVLERAFAASPYGKGLAGVDLPALVEAGRRLVDEQPLTFNDLGIRLAQRWPGRDPAALGHAVRAHVPLVQVPPRGIWGATGPAAHTSAEAWLGGSLDPAPDVERVLLRYLAAFGPASVADAQKWSGLTRLGTVARRLRDADRLVAFRADDGTELLDVPDAPRPDPDTPAPVRFLPEFDNVLIGYADRTRILSEPARRTVFTVNGLILGTVLVDGFVGATWRINRGKGGATLVVEPLARLSTNDRAAVGREGARLLDFVAPDADRHDIQIAPPIVLEQVAPGSGDPGATVMG
jgi:hypothetical protein